MNFRKIQMLFVLSALLLSTFAIAADQVTIVYPTKDKPLFSVVAPKDWELNPAEEEGGFFDLNGPSGAVLSFRAIAGSEKDLDNAMKEAGTFLGENYKNVKLGDAKSVKIDGQPAIQLSGEGSDEDGNKVVFDMVWTAMDNGHIAELWFVAEPGDKEGIAEAQAILNSFKGE